MSLQIIEPDCPCKKCSWKQRKNCAHYGQICLELRNCSICMALEKNPESCLKEEETE